MDEVENAAFPVRLVPHPDPQHRPFLGDPGPVDLLVVGIPSYTPASTALETDEF